MKRVLIGLAVMTLVLTACSGGDAAESETFEEIGSGLAGGEGQFFGDEATETTAVGAADGDLESASNQRINLDIAVAENRKVIRNASLQLATKDTRDTFDEIVRVAESLGGFVENAEVSPTGDEEQPFIQITVRIPSAELTGALNAFKDAADKVVSESQGAQDVTETFIDLEAQLTNLTALEVELRALLAEVRKQPDADPDKLLRVFTEISNTRGEIERIQGQLNYLGDAVDLATAHVSIEPTPEAFPIVEESWAPVESVRSATRSLVSGLQNFTDVVITFVIAVLPMLILVLGLPAVILYAIYRYWRSRRRNAVTPNEPLPTE